MDRTSSVVRLLVGLLCGFTAIPVLADETVDARWTFGWDGSMVVGRWTPATVEFTATQPGSYAVEVAALDAIGHTARFPTTVTDLTAGPQTLTGLFRTGRTEGALTARVLKDGVVIAERVVRPGVDTDVPRVMKLSDRLFVTVGKPRGLDSLAHTDKDGRPAQVITINRGDADKLPVSPLAYDGVRAVLLAGDQRLSESAQSALLEWVRSGGRLIVSLPKNVSGWSTNPLRPQLPVGIGAEPYVVRELGSLEVFAGRNVRIPSAGRLAVAKLAVQDGQIIAGTREEPLLVSAPLGFGEVTVLALDLTQSPLANWGGLNDFVARLLNVSNVAVNANTRRSQRVGQLTTTGITDLASQVLASQDHFDTIRGSSPWVVMGWLLVYIAIVGPVDYCLVHYVLRRPGWTWVTVLLSAAGFGWIASQAVYSAAPRTPSLRQLDVIDLDVSEHRARHRSWITHYSPVTARVDWEFSPLATPVSTVAPPVVVPFAAPEATFGGMYRAPGSEWGRTNYTIESGQGTLKQTPVLERSTQSWLATWAETDVDWIEGTLRSDGLGRLTGGITHHFPGPIEDWILAFGNRVYRTQADRDSPDSLPWDANTELYLDAPQLFQRELRGLLTGSIARLERKEQGITGSFRNEQSRYDPQSRDPLTVWQTITFHKIAGGESYTTLSNELLSADDFSRQLDLGRAVLFGRLAAPSRLAAKQSGKTLTADEQTVLVRVVIPVRRSTEIERTLPKINQ